jgi:hypothetical protein
VITEALVKIMVEVLSVLALSTKQMNTGRFCKFDLSGNCFWPNSSQRNLQKKLLGDDDMQAVLGRLDRPTPEESRTTAAQSLEVIMDSSIMSSWKVRMSCLHSYMCGAEWFSD